MVICKKGVFTNFTKFTGKHLCWSLVFNEVADLQHLILSKKRLWHRCCLANFAKLLLTPFLQNFFARMLMHDHAFCYCPKRDLLHFQKRCHIHFPAEYFLGLICRLVTKVNSIFQILISHHRSKIRNDRSSHRMCSISVLRNFAKFTGKHLCRNLFFNKKAYGLQLY